MGVDLKLLPLMAPDYWVALDILRVERRRELWPAVEALPHQPIPRPLSCYHGDNYGETINDPYACTLTWVTAADLLTIADHEAVQDNAKNRAVWAYLKELPPDWQIVLWWH